MECIGCRVCGVWSVQGVGCVGCAEDMKREKYTSFDGHPFIPARAETSEVLAHMLKHFISSPIKTERSYQILHSINP